MKWIFTLVCCLLLQTVLYAQPGEVAGTGENDPKAEAILKKVSEKYKAYKTLRAVFVLHIYSPEDDIDEQQTGTIYLKGDKYKLDIEDMEIICDNTTRWIFTHDPPEVQINYYEPEDNPMENPAKLFTIYENDFRYRLREEVTFSDGRKAWVIELIPVDKDASYFKVLLTVNMKDYSLISAKTFSKNGVQYTLTIKSFTPDLDLPDSFFSFDPKKHPGIEVVDLR